MSNADPPMALTRSHSYDGSMPLEDYEPLSISQSLSMPDLASVSQMDTDDEPDAGAKLERTVSLTEISAESGLLVVATLVFGCLAVVPLEMLNTRDRGCADLISLMEYSWAAIISLPALSRKQQIPWRYHVALLICGVTYSVCCNQALNQNLPMPVFLVLKNGLLVANMIVGRCALGKIYSSAQILAVLCVTAGLIVCTIVSARDEIERAETQAEEQHSNQLPAVFSAAFSWLRSQAISLSQAPTAESMWTLMLGLRDSQFMRGVLFMLGALGARALGSATQEVAFRTYGAHVQETIFWKSILGLPVFAMRWDDVTSHANLWMETPFNWVLLAGEVVFDYTTSRSVANLVATTSGLTVLSQKPVLQLFTNL
eukprot:COSAG02_NODE_3064_length_7435_cov_2.086150_3_plen_371_part_00